MSPRKVDSDVLDGSDGPGGDTVAGETLPANDLHRPKVEMQDDMRHEMFVRPPAVQAPEAGS